MNIESRDEFEAFISLPPHEKEISRFPDDGSSAWLGSYKNLIVDLAWETWQASRQSGDGCLHTGTLTVDHHKNDPAMQNVDYAHADGVLEPGVYKLYTHPASAERPSLGQRKADQVGTTIGVLVQTPAGSVAAVTDLGRCTWLNQDVTGAGDEVSVPTHALVYEYDGAVQCLHCGAQWGALPGNPTEPVHCAPAKGGEAVSVPEFLLEMSRQMREQPNRATAHPFWQVRCKRSLPTEQGYNESHYEVCGDEGPVYSSNTPLSGLSEYLLEHHESWCRAWASENHEDDADYADAVSSWIDPESDLPSELTLVYAQEIEEVVTTHLTQAGAEAFIKRKQHDYPKLYTYVESAYWSPQLRELQDWIIGLTPKQEQGHE